MRDRSWRYATDAQRGYLRRLGNECFARGIDTGWLDFNNSVNSERLTKQEASEKIGELKNAIERDKALEAMGRDGDELALSLFNALVPGNSYSMSEVAEILGIDYERHEADLWTAFGRLLAYNVIASTGGDGQHTEAFRFSIK